MTFIPRIAAAAFRVAVITGAAVLSLAAAAPQAEAQVLDNPTVNGLRVDRCVQGAGWSLVDPRRCDRTRQRMIANGICAVHNRGQAQDWRIGPHVGRHAVLTFPRNNPNDLNWTQIRGLDAFVWVDCAPRNRASRRFDNPTVNGLFIDRCVRGAGWSVLDPRRCDATRRQTVANRFCRDNGFARASSFNTRRHFGSHAILSYARRSGPGAAAWTQIGGADRFSRITCTA